MMPFNISEFQTYLDNITQKANLYTVIGAEGKMFDVGLMVRKLQPKQCKVLSDNNKQENIELLPVLDGIRKYAIEHVLLVDKPGSAKSTNFIYTITSQMFSFIKCFICRSD